MMWFKIFILIPTYSYIASSAARLVTELFVFVLAVILIARAGYNMVNKPNIKLFMKVMGASLLMGIFTVFLNNLNIAVLIALSAAIYFMLIILLGVLDKTDFQLTMQLVNRKTKANKREGVKPE